MRKNFIVILIICIASSQAFSQNLSSPYFTIFTHLDYLQKENYQPEISAKTIPLSVQDNEKRMELAIHLKQVLDGKGLYIYMNRVPNDVNYMDTILNKRVYVLNHLEPRIYLEKDNDKWYYSQETINNLDEMYAEVFPFGTKTFSRLLPVSFGNKHLLGLYVWQWFGLLLLIAIGGGFYILLHKTMNIVLHYIVHRQAIGSKENEETLKKLAKSFSLLIIYYIISMIVPSLQLPPLILQYVVKILAILLIFLGAIFLIKAFGLILFYFKAHAETTSSKFDDQLLPIASKLFKILVGIAAFSLALKQLDVDLTAIIAGLSIGGLALALASQDTVKNFIGTVTILIDHPFELGDYIVTNGTEGTVEQVGMRATRIRTPEQSLAYIPNGELSNMIVDNLGLRVLRRWKLIMGVEYGTKPVELGEFCERANEVINSNEWIASEKTSVTVNELGASSINILANIYLDVASYNTELNSKHELLLQLISLADEMNIGFAFPTQTLHIKQ